MPGSTVASALCLVLLLALSPPALAGSTVQDTMVVRADAPPVWGSDLRLVEEIRIGSLNGRVEEAFGSVDAVAPVPDGSVLVVDGMVPAVYRFSENGEFVESLGRSGEGPGEYRKIAALEVLSDGTVVLVDTRLARISWLDGEWNEEATAHFAGGVYSIRRLAQIGSHGEVHFNRPNLGSTWPPSEDLDWIWLTYRRSSGVVDTLVPPPEDEEGPSYSLQTADGTRNPFTVRTLNWMGPEGTLVWGRNDEYALNLELGGEKVRQIRRSFEGIPVVGEEWRQWMGFSDEFRRSRGSRYERIPNFKPVFRSLWIDTEGRIWVERYVPAVKHEYTPEELARIGDGRTLYEWREPTVYDVLDPAGVFLGQVTLPPRTGLAYARGHRIWAVQRGELDEAYVVRFRIEATESPA